MRTLRLILISLFVAVGHLLANGQPTFRLIDTYMELPDNEVKAMFKVPDGRLGIRTSSSLSLFDGCKVRSFYPIGDEGYPMDYVASLPTAYVDAEQRVWLKEVGHLLVFDIKRESYVKDVKSLLSLLGFRGRIKDFFIDSSKDFWVLTDQGKLFKGGSREGKQAVMQVKARTKGLRDIVRKGDLAWLVYDDGWLVEFNLKTQKSCSSQKLWEGRIAARDFIHFAQAGDQLWVMWNHGVALYQPKTHQWQCRFRDDEHIFVSISPTAQGDLYLAVRQFGLVTLTSGGKVESQRSFSVINGERVEDDVEAVLYDQGNLVLGLSANGICFYNPNMQQFPFVSFKDMRVDMGSYRINDFMGGQAVLSTRLNLYVFNPYHGTFAPLTPQPFGSEFVRAISDSKGRFWAGTFRNGMYMIEKGKVFHLMQGEIPSKDVNYNIVRGFLEDRSHCIWLHYHGGIGWFDEKNKRIIPVRNELLSRYKVVNDFQMDKKGNLWVATSTGLFLYSPNQNKVYLPKDLVDDHEMQVKLNGSCKSVLVDSHGLVWVGTLNGLYMINPYGRKAKRFGKESGMSNEVIQGIVEDKNGNLWVSTSYGLSFLQRSGTDDFVLTVFDDQNRLRDCRFSWMAAGHIADGKLIFGVKDGFYVVNPDEIKVLRYTGHPIFTSLSVNNQEILPGKEYDGRVILESALAHSSKVVLKHNENFITVQFSGLNFDMPNHTYFKYRLKGSNEHWIEISPQDGVGKASYTDLEPGTYELEVYSAGFDKKWSDHPIALQIVVEAPLWATWWAKTIYVFLFLGILVYGIRRKMEQNRQRLEMEKNKELEDMKYRFFTNISHEFRTLLTLIITPIGSVLRRTTDAETRRQLSDVSKNAGDLLQLVNQLLDFRKMEMNGDQLSLTSGNLDEFVQYTAMKFKPLAEQKQIALEVIDASGGIFMYFDRDKVGKILNNLLSNAFKFTEKNGTIKVALSKEIVNSRRFARIEVKDTGCGISKKDQQHIFERFFRGEKQTGTNVGSGIGLNMVAEYVRLHQGIISVESELGEGSCFIVKLPTDLKEESKNEVDVPMESVVLGESAKENPASSVLNVLSDKVVLVVEDNDEFRHFMQKELSRIYCKVLTAEDGMKGVLLAEEQNPDIIVSDVMMPRMNGVEMCRRIKENIQTSHIPVILLTAWSTSDGQTDAYKVGADDYIAKPFDMEMLLARIKNLLERQDKRILDFSHSLSLDAKSVTDSSPDEAFLNEIIACIEKNIDNTEYTIDSLAHDVVMSRMSLYRKMKSLTGQTPADFIRTVRLKSAANLLKTGKYNVSEVCYRTGFASPQNFTKHFKEMFGVLPSQYFDTLSN